MLTMKHTWPESDHHLEASIKTAQYLASLTTQQDVWAEVTKVLVNFWGADLVAIGSYHGRERPTIHHWVIADPAFEAALVETMAERMQNPAEPPDLLGSESREAMIEVLDSGFVAWRLIDVPEPLSLVFLPINQEHRVTAVLLVGHRIDEPFPRDLFNVYLAVAGLVGTTVMRLAAEIELREYRQHLEALVHERTARLNETNAQLQREIAERIRAEQIITQMAYHDALTGLPNRRLFNDRLAVAMAYAQRNEQKLVLLLLDLDFFKQINDTLGHDVGDQLLKAIGERLNGLIRKSDTIARMGGDEFMLLLTEIEAVEDATTATEKILQGLLQPFVLEQHTLQISASIGMAIYPDDGADAAILMKHADIAMYQVKESGRAGFRQWEENS